MCCMISRVLLVSVLKQCLEKALKVPDPNSLPLVNRILLSTIYQCSRDEGHDRAVRDLQSAFDGRVISLLTSSVFF